MAPNNAFQPTASLRSAAAERRRWASQMITLLVGLSWLGVSAAGQPKGPPPEASLTYEQVQQLFIKGKDKPEFRQYLSEFVQWNNANKLDERHGCFQKGNGPVKVYLIITDRAVIEPVVSSTDTAKSYCFRLSYLGLKVKPPPYSPLVIEFNFP